MSREGIGLELGQHYVTVQELTYSAPHVSVYRGTQRQVIVAVKILPWQQGTDYTVLERECQTMQSLSHPNILRLHDCFWVTKDDRTYYVIVTEWCEKDLDRDIKQRSLNTFPFTEPQLLELARQMIEALAFMQAQGMAHRDLKPQNIFLTSDKIAKIGDFGSASWSSTGFGELVGTPYYLSPLLKQAFHAHQTSVQHNVFKSDVYSLGLTFLAAAKLGVSQVFVESPSDEVMGVEINNINYTEELKTLLRAMLGYEEPIRWDFLQLKEWINRKPWGVEHPPPYRPPAVSLPPVQLYPEISAYAPSPIATVYPNPPQRQPPPQPAVARAVVQTPPSQAVYHIPFASPSPSPSVASNLKQPLLPRLSPLPPLADIPVLCMGCRKPIDRRSLQSPVVQLPCRPDLDMYCTPYCFAKAFHAHQPYICPNCNAEVDPPALTDLTEIEKQFPSCVVCNKAINTKDVYYQREFERAECNDPQHIFCSRECSERANRHCSQCRNGKGRGGYWPFGVICCCFLVVAGFIGMLAWLTWPSTVV